jgi:hypothetical protein
LLSAVRRIRRNPFCHTEGVLYGGREPYLKKEGVKSTLLTLVAHICGKIVKARKDADFSGKTFPVEHSCGTIINRN